MGILSIIRAHRPIADDTPWVCEDLSRLIARHLLWRCLRSQIEARQQATPYDNPYYGGYRPPHHSLFTSMSFNSTQVIIRIYQIISWAITRCSIYRESHIWKKRSLYYPYVLSLNFLYKIRNIFIRSKINLHSCTSYYRD